MYMFLTLMYVLMNIYKPFHSQWNVAEWDGAVPTSEEWESTAVWSSLVKLLI